MFYSGIDQHKRDSFITTYGPDGDIVRRERLLNTPQRVAAYFTQFDGPHRAVVESTGCWYWLADVLHDLGVELVLAHATRLKAISTAKVKTDKLDADVLGLLLRAGLIPAAHMISPAKRGPRDLMRTRLRLIEKRHSAQNSIARLLEKFNVESVSDLDAWYSLQAECYRAQIDLLNTQVQAVELRLQPLLIPNADVQRLLWIPGIGKVNAFTIYTEVADIARFPSVKQFCSYCRLVPGADNSGGRTRHKSGSKIGNRYLRVAFIHAAVRAMQYNPEIRAFYQAKAASKPLRIARTLVALELARIVYHVLARRVNFNGRFKGELLGRRKQLQWPRLASPAV